MKAQDVMVSPVITVSENSTVRDLAKLLLTNRISAVPWSIRMVKWSELSVRLT